MGEDGGGLIGCAVSVWEFMSAGRKKKRMCRVCLLCGS